MGLRPCFEVVANGNDISGTIYQLFESISITDKTGIESDTCEISLIDDPTQPIEMPKKGAELKISMGYDGQLQPMGLFIVDEVELSGPPDKMIIRCRASVQIESKEGKVSLQTQKNRAWPKDTTIENVVKKIATEHNLGYLVSDQLKNVKLPQITQSEESDLSFLMRLSKRYDAICKPANGKILFVKRGEIDLGTFELSRYQVSSWSMTSSTRDSSGTVIAYWHPKKQAKRIEVKVGDGEPVRRLKHPYLDENSARVAAQSALDQAKRNEDKLTINLPGNPLLSAEVQLSLSQFREGIDGEWIIESVTHTIDKSVGFSGAVEAVKTLNDEEIDE